MGRLSMHSKGLDFFLLSFGVGDLFSFFCCSQHVPNGFHHVPKLYPYKKKLERHPTNEQK
jgi:hypothetical protein